LFSVWYPASLKQLVEAFEILQHPLLGFLLDGIQFYLDVISVDITIFLHNQGLQLSPIGWYRLQPLEPLLGSTLQIKLGNLEKFVSIEIAHFGRHRETLRLVIDILMISSPEQLIHSLGTSHLASV